jgi:hypothetical protein
MENSRVAGDTRSQKLAESGQLGMRFRTFAFFVAVGVGVLSVMDTARGQDLGHKLPGLIGLDAGKIPEPGLYLLDRFALYEASELRDRLGEIIPIGELRLQALSNAVGLSYTIKLPRKSLSLTATAAGPIARFRLNVQDRPETSFDRFGLADIYVQPARLGWRQDHFDLIGSYGLYLPTGLFTLAGGKGVSAGHVTHEFSAGGSIYADKNRRNFVTALASYDLNLRKRGVDITRGDTLQIQGGVGVSRFNQRVEAGLAGYALWQVRDDRGADLPLVLRGGRDRVYGLGPEIAVTIPAIRSQIRTRYEWDIGVRSRPRGKVFSVALNVLVQHPTRPVTP